MPFKVPPVGRPHCAQDDVRLTRAFKTTAAALTVAGAVGSGYHMAREGIRPGRLHPLALLFGSAAALGMALGSRRPVSNPLAGRTPDARGIVRIPPEEMPVINRWFWTELVPSEDLVTASTLNLPGTPFILRYHGPGTHGEMPADLSFPQAVASLLYETERIGGMDGDEALLKLRECETVRTLISHRVEGDPSEKTAAGSLEPLLDSLSEAERAAARGFFPNGKVDVDYTRILFLARAYRGRYLAARVRPLPAIPLVIRGLRMSGAADNALPEPVRPDEGITVFVPPEHVETVADLWDRTAWETWRPARFVPWFPEPGSHPDNPAEATKEAEKTLLMERLRDETITGWAQEGHEQVITLMREEAIDYYSKAHWRGMTQKVRLERTARALRNNTPMEEEAGLVDLPVAEGILRVIDSPLSWVDKNVAIDLVWDADLFVPPEVQERLVERMRTFEPGEAKALREELRGAFRRYYPWAARVLGDVIPLAPRPIPRERPAPAVPALTGQEEKKFGEFRKRALKAGVVSETLEAIRLLLIGMGEERKDAMAQLARSYRPAHFDFLREYDSATDPGGEALRRWFIPPSAETASDAEAIPVGAELPPMPVTFPSPPPEPVHAVVLPRPRPIPLPPPPPVAIPWWERPEYYETVVQVHAGIDSLPDDAWDLNRLTRALIRLKEATVFDAAVRRMRESGSDLLLAQTLDHEAANPIFLRYFLLAVDLLGRGKLTMAQIRQMAGYANSLEVRMPKSGKVVNNPYWKTAFLRGVPHHFGTSRFPLMAELEAIAGFTADADVSQVTVLPEGPTAGADFSVRRRGGQTVLIEVKSLRDTHERVDVLVTDLAFKLEKGALQLARGGEPGGTILVCLDCDVPEREMVLVSAMEEWVKSDFRRRHPDLEVTIIPRRRMVHFT